ncbi:MAG: hypothetical protein JXA15_00895 [Spirochaetales bacterium]|nr:hypothetical protein [Spirochaetales bacterium]
MFSTTRANAARTGARRGALAVLAALALFALPQETAAESAGVRLEWTSVDGARSYLVEVRGPGGAGILFSASTTDAWVEAPLPPGDYEIRVSALNVFGKAVAVGEWTSFAVRATARLEEASILPAPEADRPGSGLVVIRVAVSGAMPETVARLEGDGVRVEATGVELDDSGLAASFDLSGLPEGDYDLVLENPGGYSTTLAAAVRVAAPGPEPAAGPETGTELAGGTDLEAETGTELAEGTDLEPEPVAETGTELAEGTDLEPEPVPEMGTELAAGTDLEAVSEPEPEPEPEPAPEPVAASEAEPADGGRGAAERRSREPVPLRFETSAGWRPAFALDADWGESYEAGWAGAELALGLRLTERAPAWLRAASLEFRVEAFSLPGVTGAFIDTAEALALAASLELGAAWRVLDWLEVALRGGGALFATHVTRSGLIGDFDAWSLGDPAAQGSLSTRFMLGRFLVETGCAWQHVFYLDVPADFLRPFLRLGWSFGR